MLTIEAEKHLKKSLNFERLLKKSIYLHGADNVSIVIEKLEELFQAAEAALAASQHKPSHKFESQH